tara:strand:- start:3084 stop:3380 length:297 start_codon:yes stop_codon:yes gene_type:complete
MVDRKKETNTTRSTEQVDVDRVNNPPHYTTGRIECIDAMEAMMEGSNVPTFVGNLWGNLFKYIWRWDKKGTAIEQLQKARYYLDKMIEYAEKERRDEV